MSCVRCSQGSCYALAFWQSTDKDLLKWNKFINKYIVFPKDPGTLPNLSSKYKFFTRRSRGLSRSRLVSFISENIRQKTVHSFKKSRTKVNWKFLLSWLWSQSFTYFIEDMNRVFHWRKCFVKMFTTLFDGGLSSIMYVNDWVQLAVKLLIFSWN